jgi:hypothetical protein
MLAGARQLIAGHPGVHRVIPVVIVEAEGLQPPVLLDPGNNN